MNICDETLIFTLCVFGCVFYSCHESSSEHEHSHEPSISATGDSLFSTEQHVQPQQVRLSVRTSTEALVLSLSNPSSPISLSDLPPGWEVDIQHDVIEECNKHGGVVHIYVDKNSEVLLAPV